MEKISWTDHVRNEKVLQRVKEERKIERIIKRKMACWIGHIMCRNCLLKHFIVGKLEGRIEVTGGEEEYVSSYWPTLRKREDTVN